MLKIVLFAVLSFTLTFAFPYREQRIFNGRNALPGEVPYIASLRFWGTTHHFAGATLLNNRWVLTVAHPLIGRAGSSINIVVGTNMLNAGVVNRRSSAIRIHELFDQVTKRNDIACIQSATIITFTQFITPIPISPSFIENGIIGLISGWGATENSNGADSNTLRVANVETVPCINNNDFTFTQHHMCAGSNFIPSPPIIASLCTTDIGGPMVFNGQLIGIAAWIPVRCGSLADGYNRASSYRTWILGII
ncbi:hypothetical protein PVAND_001340 [Polypedilum vanderplanki]|uniref:Peptidase S1 domain-containing protein n=1 Tax=Polypedilum vanderplanki TaxID=319348 RepID=A0A9J6BNY8_POLVA|nr:hypothetical protein PVAND_001340 [Polypedilum vanderplanki]